MNIKLISLIGTIFVAINFNYCNSSSIKQELVNKNNDTQHDQQYWNEFLPTIKCNAKETLKDRFEYCTNWLLELINSNNFFYKTTPYQDMTDYDISSVNDIIDVKQLKQEIELRKILLNDMHHKDELNGNAWSTIPLTINGCNPSHQRKIGQYLQFDCKLVPNHWYMKFETVYTNVKLHFYSSYEYQDPYLYHNSINSEETLSICMSGIEMDLLTSNESTGNIELLANYLIFKRDKFASNEITRYTKYLTKEQNMLLAKHIIAYYLSFPNIKQHNVPKYLLTNYVLKNLFKNMRPNQFLSHINKVKTNNWCEIIIDKYLDNEFWTEYNKDYLKSFKTMIQKNKNQIINIILPEFSMYTTLIFNRLVNKHNSMNIENKKILLTLSGAFYGNKIIDNIMSYVSFKPLQNNKHKLNK